jgi:hypothetical protein
MYTDVDYYKRPELAETHAAGVLDLALEYLVRERIPYPSLAMATGRGLALVWRHKCVGSGLHGPRSYTVGEYGGPQGVLSASVARRVFVRGSHARLPRKTCVASFSPRIFFFRA